MVTLADLEKRIIVLEDIMAITKMKAKFWYSLDSKLWDDVASCVTEDVVEEVPSLFKIEGRDALIQFFKASLGPDVVTVHQGHHHEIDILSDTTAKGRWSVRDHVINRQINSVWQGRYHYHDEYRKENGEWKVSKMSEVYLLTEGQKKGYGQDLAIWPAPPPK